MKKAIGIICILGILSLSSCRSTANPCGLAEKSTLEIPISYTDDIVSTNSINPLL